MKKTTSCQVSQLNRRVKKALRNLKITIRSLTGGYKFCFSNGLQATLHRFDSRKTRRLANLCVRSPLFTGLKMIKKNQHKQHYFVEVEVHGKKIYLLYAYLIRDNFFLGNLKKLDENRIELYYCARAIIYEDKIYTVTNQTTRAFWFAISKQEKPEFCALFDPIW